MAIDRQLVADELPCEIAGGEAATHTRLRGLPPAGFPD
jgi:hypothetical protein